MLALCQSINITCGRQMSTKKVSFNIALFAIAFVICLLGAIIVIATRKPAPELDGVDAAAQQPSHASSRSTPVPELAAAATPVPGTPIPPAPNLATPRTSGIDADDGGSEGTTSGRSMADDQTSGDDVYKQARRIYAGRAASSQAMAEAELPITTMADIERDNGGSGRATPAPLISMGKEIVAANDTDRLRDLPRGYMIGKQEIRPVESSDVTPQAAPVEMVDMSGGTGQEMSTTRAEELIRKYRSDDLPPTSRTPPPIAVPEALRPKIFTPTPTPGVLNRARNAARNAAMTPLPMVTNMNYANALPPGTVPGRGNLGFPSDAGSVPYGASFEDPAKRSQRRLNDALARASAPVAADQMAISGPAGTVAGLATPVPIPSSLATPPPNIVAGTPHTFTVKKGKAQVSFANVPPGWAQANGQSAALPGVGTPASPRGTMGPLTNAPGMASPVPSSSAAVASKYQLPPAPTLPPRPIAPDSGAAVARTPDPMEKEAAVSPTPSDDSEPGTVRGPSHLQPNLSALPPDIAQRLGAVAGPQARVGTIELSKDELTRQSNAMLALRGITNLGADERIVFDRQLAQEWAERKAMAEEAKRQGVSVTDDEVTQQIEKQKERTGKDFEAILTQAGMTSEEIRANMRDAALGDKLIEAAFEKGGFKEDKKLREVYDLTPTRFQPSRRIHVCEIFRRTPADPTAAREVEKQMDALQRDLQRGADFSAAAGQVSDSKSKEKNGDLGWLDATSNIGSEMVEALAKLQPGQVSPVIKVRNGLQIVKLAEVEDPKPGFEGARDNVIAGIRQGLRTMALEGAKEHFDVKVGQRKLKSEAQELADQKSQAQTAPGAQQNGRAKIRSKGQESRQVPLARSGTSGMSEQATAGQAQPAGFR